MSSSTQESTLAPSKVIEEPLPPLPVLEMNTTVAESEPLQVADGSQFCGWHFSSKGCVMSGVPMKDVCSDEGCNIMFHHACQTEWEFHQYRLKYPEGDPSKCAYDSDGKKKCMRHHPFSAIAMSTAVPDVQFGPHHNDEFEDYANVEQNEDKTPKKGKSNNINTPAKLTKQQKTEQKQQRMQLLRTMTRQDNKDRSYLDRVRKKRDGIKSDLRACLQEYNRIKLEIGYTSPPPSDNDGADSLSDESHAANNNENNDDGHESA
jgi:hypothetical protein